MEPDWLKAATGPGLWIIACVFAGNALIQSVLFYRLSRRVGTRLQMSEAGMNEALRASFITSLGPAFGSFVGMTVPALLIIFWVAALGSFGWVLVGGVFTRWLPKIKDLIGGGDTRRLQLISAAIMLAAFSRLLANDSILPLLRDGRWPAMVASVAGGVAALAWLLHADRANRPALKEYVVIVALEPRPDRGRRDGDAGVVHVPSRSLAAQGARLD